MSEILPALDSGALNEAPDTFLSQGQRAALDRIEKLWKIRHQSAGPVAVTGLYPMVVGEPGSGKSHLVAQFASRLGLGLIPVSAPSWIPRGAYTRPHTIDWLRGQLERKASGIIHLMGLDGFPRDRHEVWNQGVAHEISALLRGELGELSWSRAQMESFRKQFWIVGEGSWSDLHCSMDVDPEAWKHTGDVVYEIERRKLMPASILHSFNPVAVEVVPPGEEDCYDLLYRFYRENAPVPEQSDLDRTARELAASERGFRAICAYFQERLLDRAAGAEVPQSDPAPLRPSGGSASEDWPARLHERFQTLMLQLQRDLIDLGALSQELAVEPEIHRMEETASKMCKAMSVSEGGYGYAFAQGMTMSAFFQRVAYDAQAFANQPVESREKEMILFPALAHARDVLVAQLHYSSKPIPWHRGLACEIWRRWRDPLRRPRLRSLLVRWSTIALGVQSGYHGLMAFPVNRPAGQPNEHF